MEIATNIFSNLAAASTDQTNLPAIPSGVAVTVTKFGGADLNLGDGLSTGYLLQWGSGGAFTIVAAIALTGNTFEYEMNQQFLGDGVKFFRITRQNNSAHSKICPCWLKGFY